MADRIIQTADLSGIKNRLDILQGHIAAVDTHVAEVDANVASVASELEDLIAEFHAFVQQQELRNREQIAETRVVKLRQELNKKFGHYDVIRRTAVGILQATDLGIIRKEIINNATEDMMIKTPNYWLAPCLVALSAWIADKRELAEKAVREALARDDEKTSLFFALICRRADRKLACVQWVNRYLENQSEEKLDRKTIIVLSAYANGLWGNDAEGIVTRTISKWIENLESKPGAIQQQQQWMQAIRLKEPKVDQHLNYPYLQKYSPTWGAIRQMIAGAYLHQSLLEYFQNIFTQQNSTRELKQNLDAILDRLVTDFDDEELPLRQKVQLEQLVIDFHGNEAEAKKHMEVQKTAFETHKDFIQLLTDASMNPQLAHADAATQKFAIALSKDWILSAYQEVIAQNRSQVPADIVIKLGYDFQKKTQNGENEQEILADWDQYIEEQKQKVLQEGAMTSWAQTCKTLRWLLIVIGVVLCLLVSIWGLVTAIFLGIAAVYCQSNYAKQKKRYEQAQQEVQKLEEVSRPNGQQMLRAMLAEVVDLRSDYAEQDAKAEQTIDFIKGLKANQFTLPHADGTRRMNLQRK